MKYYELKYVLDNNGETGAGLTIDIAKSTDKSEIEDIIKSYDLEVVTNLERGQDHVFWLVEYEPVEYAYFYPDKLFQAIQTDNHYRRREY